MWLFNGKEIKSHDDLLEDCTDIVYVIVYKNGKKYLGKKVVKSVRKKPPLKGKKRVRRLLTNVPFVEYEGSHEQEEPLEIDRKIILYQCRTRKAATYLENALIFHYGALFSDEYLNKNLGGLFYDNDLDGLLETNTEDEY